MKRTSRTILTAYFLFLSLGLTPARAVAGPLAAQIAAQAAAVRAAAQAAAERAAQAAAAVAAAIQAAAERAAQAAAAVAAAARAAAERAAAERAAAERAIAERLAAERAIAERAAALKAQVVSNAVPAVQKVVQNVQERVTARQEERRETHPILAAIAGKPSPAVSPLLVDTSSGPLEGFFVGDTRTFLGVPYALPPVGALRWRQPVPFPRSPTRRLATQPGPGCVQPEHTDAKTGVGSGPVRGSEDCLHLNVWAPRTGSRRAVMVFIHGGGFTSGSSLSTTLKPGSLPLYDGAELSASGDVVVVTVEYRLGALGFLAHPAIGSGNYGLFDVIEALRWVQTNIAAFGGNPGNVTIFGESAGGMTICSLLASPRASRLFQSAILQSFNCPSEPLAEALPRGVALASQWGCPSSSDASCLRGKRAEDFVMNVNQFARGGDQFLNVLTFRPVIDGNLLTEPSRTVIRQGRGQPAHVMAGHNSGEFPAASLPDEQKRWTPAAFHSALVAQYGSVLGTRLFAAYNPGLYPSVSDAVADYKTDLQFTCHAELVLRAYASQGRSTYGYVFSQPPFAYLQSLLRALSFLKDGESFTPMKPFHGAELLYVFQKIDESYAVLRNGIDVPRFSQDKRTESHLGRYWTSFAKIGDPNDRALAAWPRYENGARTLSVLKADPGVMSGAYRAKCDLVDAALDAGGGR